MYLREAKASLEIDLLLHSEFKGQIFTFMSVFIWKLWRFKELKVINGFACAVKVWTNFVLRTHMISCFLYCHYFQMKTDKNLKIWPITKP